MKKAGIPVHIASKHSYANSNMDSGIFNTPPPSVRIPEAFFSSSFDCSESRENINKADFQK